MKEVKVDIKDVFVKVKVYQKRKKSSLKVYH